jgi:predicted O-linked N-acetylglucosamine transferase (SPINDLY family)
MFLTPFPFGNTNGLVDAVRHGLPGVCLTGPEVHSHIDEGLFRRFGLSDWLITHSEEEYIKAAIRLVENVAEREHLREHLCRVEPDAILLKGDPGLFANAVEWLYRMHRSGLSGTEGKVLAPPR